jgi:hypothetical protein
VKEEGVCGKPPRLKIQRMINGPETDREIDIENLTRRAYCIVLSGFR